MESPGSCKKSWRPGRHCPNSGSLRDGSAQARRHEGKTAVTERSQLRTHSSSQVSRSLASGQCPGSGRFVVLAISCFQQCQRSRIIRGRPMRLRSWNVRERRMCSHGRTVDAVFRAQGRRCPRGSQRCARGRPTESPWKPRSCSCSHVINRAKPWGTRSAGTCLSPSTSASFPSSRCSTGSYDILCVPDELDGVAAPATADCDVPEGDADTAPDINTDCGGDGPRPG